jgi:hypothetical protein
MMRMGMTGMDMAVVVVVVENSRLVEEGQLGPDLREIIAKKWRSTC